MADIRPHSVVTPPINATGVYTLYTPFATVPGVIYRCSAIRSFAELVKHGIDVYAVYYLPLNIDDDTYKIDVGLSASIITLVSGAGEEIYVPNTYLESYPGDSGILYSRKVVVIELGMMPDTVSVDHVLPLLADTIHKNVGVTSAPQVATVPYPGSVTHDEHIQLEASRRASILNYTTLAEDNVKLTATNAALLEQNTALLEIISAHPELFVRT